MEKKKSFGERLEAFFTGKGFYIVLFLCVAVIGVSAWILLAGTGTDVEDEPVAAVVREVEPEETLAPAVKPEPIIIEEPEPAEEPAVAPAEVPAEEPAEVWSESPPAYEASALYIWPLVGEIENPYSVDALVYSKTMRDWRIHDGVDVVAELGAQVMAVSSGRVTDIYKDDLYGVTVVIEHSGGLVSIYSNLAETPVVMVGDNVVTGDIIGAVGDTALGETGEVYHLHLAMKADGVSVNPADYLPER